eukprot:1653057-Rhodomonas_salina.2
MHFALALPAGEPRDSRSRAALVVLCVMIACVGRVCWGSGRQLLGYGPCASGVVLGIQTCHLGVRFTDEELALLFCKYERNAEFNYYRFCRDLEMAQQGLHLGAR